MRLFESVGFQVSLVFSLDILNCTMSICFKPELYHDFAQHRVIRSHCFYFSGCWIREEKKCP